MIAMFFPVFGHQPRETVATFFTWSDAVSFVSANRHGGEGEPTGFERRNLYLDEPRYDRRAQGYRAAEPLTEITEIRPGAIAA